MAKVTQGDLNTLIKIREYFRDYGGATLSNAEASNECLKIRGAAVRHLINAGLLSGVCEYEFQGDRPVWTWVVRNPRTIVEAVTA